MKRTEWSQVFTYEDKFVQAQGKSRHTLNRKQRRELSQVLKLAHSIPMASRTSQGYTLGRIQGRFWWPGLERDVEQYVRSCPECQQKSRMGEQKVLMMKMPIIRNLLRGLQWEDCNGLSRLPMDSQCFVLERGEEMLQMQNYWKENKNDTLIWSVLIMFIMHIELLDWVAWSRTPSILWLQNI